MVEKSPAGVKGAAQLHAYWVSGPGLKLWADSPHPWQALYDHLIRYLNPELAKKTTSKWHNEIFQSTGHDSYRVEHGGKMRGKVIGPG